MVGVSLKRNLLAVGGPREVGVPVRIIGQLVNSVASDSEDIDVPVAGMPAEITDVLAVR